MHDLIVLGGGPGGYLAAERAGERGAEADVRSNPGPTR